MNRHLPLKTMISSLRHKNHRSSRFQVFPYRHFVDEHHHYPKTTTRRVNFLFQLIKRRSRFLKETERTNGNRAGARRKERKVHHIKGKHRGCVHNHRLSGGSPNPLPYISNRAGAHFNIGGTPNERQKYTYPCR